MPRYGLLICIVAVPLRSWALLQKKWMSGGGEGKFLMVWVRPDLKKKRTSVTRERYSFKIRSGYGYGPVSLIILATGTAYHHVTQI